MKRRYSAFQIDGVEAFGRSLKNRGLIFPVHVTGRASAVDDLRNLDTVRNLRNFQMGKRIAIYPPPTFNLGMSLEIPPD